MSDPRPVVSIEIPGGVQTYPCAPGESLLRGMLRLGRKGIPVGCINGGCGVCKVRVLSGELRRLGPVSRAHVTEAEEAAGWTLACRVGPLTDVRLEVAGRLSKPFRAQTGEVVTSDGNGAAPLPSA